jgi:hypothetical protein
MSIRQGTCPAKEPEMEELINQVTQKTGISADKARSAVETVVNFLKSKLPPALSSHLDSFLSGQGGGGMGDLAGKIGDMLGKKG